MFDMQHFNEWFWLEIRAERGEIMGVGVDHQRDFSWAANESNIEKVYYLVWF